MSRATIEREIVRLEALGRSRELDKGESIQLQKMIGTERAYERMRRTREAAAEQDAQRANQLQGEPLTIEALRAIDDDALSKAAAAALLAEIDAWCDRTGTRDSHFGQMALDFGGFVGLLRKRGTARGRSAHLARTFIARWPHGVPDGHRDQARTDAFNLLYPFRVPDTRRGRSSVDVVDDEEDAAPSGAQLADQVRAAAREAGVSVIRFVLPVTRNGSTWLTQIEQARRPNPVTIERVRALIAGEAIPAAPPKNFQRPIAEQVRAEADELTARRSVARRTGSVTLKRDGILTLDRPPVPPPASYIDREPCFNCGVRGDIGCIHRPLAMRA